MQIHKEASGVFIASYHLWSRYNAFVVLDPLSEPNWSLSGLKSESTSRASEDFGIGMTFANLHWVGTKPSRIEALKINASGRDKEEAFSRRNQDRISSGSAAEWGFEDLKVFSVSMYRRLR
jgi:hypothetical protein